MISNKLGYNNNINYNNNNKNDDNNNVNNNYYNKRTSIYLGCDIIIISLLINSNELSDVSYLFANMPANGWPNLLKRYKSINSRTEETVARSGRIHIRKLAVSKASTSSGKGPMVL